MSASASLALRVVGELVALLDRQAERGRERLERLDAADVRARDEPLDPEPRAASAGSSSAWRRPRSSSGRRRSSPFQSLRSAGPGMANEQDRHQAPSANARRTSRSRDQVSRRGRVLRREPADLVDFLVRPELARDGRIAQ